MDLDSMKYADLRSLAKELGVKANMKADKLLKAIKQHYEEEKQEEKEVQGHDGDTVPHEENVAQENPKEEVCGSGAFVNTRRGRGPGTKRRVTEAKSSTEAPQVHKEACSSAKKRKVSSDKDSRSISEVSSEEQQPDVKDEAPVPVETEKPARVIKAGRIPRYQGLQQKRTTLKPTTPNFQKLHEAQFNKMESIDAYVQRKVKQTGSSVKELSDKTKRQADVKPPAKATPARTSMFSPHPGNDGMAEGKRRHTLMSASKAVPAGKDASFRPLVLSTRRINVRFSEATRDNEFKRSLVKTPARMSTCLSSSTPLKPAAGAEKPSGTKASALSARNTPVPFLFSANTSTSGTPGTQKKPGFDLKASLSRPLTWKPHKGKLKPLGENKENPADKSQISNPRQETYKQHKVQSRDDRRAMKADERKQKKANVLGARRGLVMM